MSLRVTLVSNTDFSTRLMIPTDVSTQLLVYHDHRHVHKWVMMIETYQHYLTVARTIAWHESGG